MKPIILVTGLARSGLTMTMQMLHAGGLNCLGEFPAFEPYGIGDIPWEKCEGIAVKLIDPQLQRPPSGREYKIILLHRNAWQQAKSTIKFVRALTTGIIPPPSTFRLMRSIRRDCSEIRQWARQHDRISINFEDIVKHPTAAALRIESFVGEKLDTVKMSAAVIPRGTACLKGLLEIDMIEKGGQGNAGTK